MPARDDLDLPDRGDAAVDARATSRMRRNSRAAFTSASSRASMGVVPAWPAAARDGLGAAHVADDALTTPSGAPASASRGPCSWWTSRNAPGSAPSGAGAAPLAAALLVPERDGGQRRPPPAEPLNGLQRRDDAERSVVLATLRHRVEMGSVHTRAATGRRPAAGPIRFRGRRPPPPGRLGHPRGRQPVRLVLLGRVADAVGTRPPPIA